MNSWPWTICMFVFFVIFHYNGCLGCLEEERVALLRLKDSIKWNHTDCLRTDDPDRFPRFCTWVDDKTSDCCTWGRVKCSNTTGRVTELFLQEAYPFNFEEYNQFPDVSLYTPFEELQHLDLSRNFLNWTIEDLERLSKLKKLEVLDLGLNQFVNKSNIAPSIPTKVLFSNNSDKSTVPFPGELKSLKTLILSWNGLGGSLSDFAKVITILSNLEVLDLSWNNLHDFPVLINLSNLEVLDLSGNNLDDFHDLRNMSKLKILNVNYNNFLGRIPPSILSLSSLEDLSLRRTNIKDSISMLTNSSNLEVLDLSDNYLDGFELEHVIFDNS